MIGYRAWTIPRGNGRLNPLYRAIAGSWKPGLNVAVCAASEYDVGLPFSSWHGEAPSPKCECGFWFRPTMESATKYLHQQAQLCFYVIGMIETHGRHIEHASGTRCEKAQIMKLFKVSYDETVWTPWHSWYAQDEDIDRAASFYDVPCEYMAIDMLDRVH